jgi:hypothetical protein
MRRTPALPLIAVVLAAAGCGKRLAPPLEIPSADQIVEMRASAPETESFGKPTEEFVVPPEHVSQILFWLLPAEPDRFSVSGGVESGVYFHVADVLVRAKGGKELRLRCHDWGKNPVAFTPNGKDYYLGRSTNEQGRGIDGGAKLYVAIEKAHQASQAKKAGP